MFLSRWVVRFGQTLAPDENAPEAADDSYNILSVVAPDPQFYGSPSEEAKAKTPPPKRAFSHPFTTPNKDGEVGEKDDDERVLLSPLERKVLDASRETAFAMTSPTGIWDKRRSFFQKCTKDEALKKLKKALEKDPSLISARTCKLLTIPDGYTALHVASMQGALEVAKYLVTVDKDLIKATDPMGRTPLHLAAEYGKLELVAFLHDFQESEQAPVDLAGRTPLGCAMTSGQADARKNRESLEKCLFSPGDRSLCGPPTPAVERLVGMDIGIAEMPGKRIHMEDSMMHMLLRSPNSSDKDGEDWALVGVMDGHGDMRKCSQFVADHFAILLQETREWLEYKGSGTDSLARALMKTCTLLDIKMKEEGMSGGTTAVVALITKETVLVVNVGDCRCILVQKPKEEDVPPLKEEQGPQTPGEENKEQVEPKTKEANASNVPSLEVTALSEDHKPYLEAEEERIEKAGMDVVSQAIMQRGEEVTIWKIQKSPSEFLAVTRSFGDYEYKENSALPPEEQAVVATPDVTIHSRDSSRDMYLVLACDGIWDVMTNEEVGQFVSQKVEESTEVYGVLPQVGDELLEECLKRGSADNMSAIIVSLQSMADRIQGKALFTK